jgi:hypothetical protein
LENDEELNNEELYKINKYRDENKLDNVYQRYLDFCCYSKYKPMNKSCFSKYLMKYGFGTERKQLGNSRNQYVIKMLESDR